MRRMLILRSPPKHLRLLSPLLRLFVVPPASAEHRLRFGGVRRAGLCLRAVSLSHLRRLLPLTMLRSGVQLWKKRLVRNCYPSIDLGGPACHPRMLAPYP